MYLLKLSFIYFCAKNHVLPLKSNRIFENILGLPACESALKIATSLEVIFIEKLLIQSLEWLFQIPSKWTCSYALRDVIFYMSVKNKPSVNL